jgi:hypothetical protein
MANGDGRESLETMASRAVVGVPMAWRIFQGLGSAASTALLVILTFAFQTVRSEWQELRAEMAEIRAKLALQPSPEEFGKIRDDLHDIDRRVIRLESEYYGAAPVRERDDR